MTEILKLAGESVAALAVGKKVVEAQYDLLKYYVIRESSRMMSSAISLMLFGLGLFMLTMVILVGLGYWVSQIFANTYLIFIVPGAIMLVLLLILWSFRAFLFRSFTRQIVKDIFD